MNFTLSAFKVSNRAATIVAICLLAGCHGKPAPVETSSLSSIDLARQKNGEAFDLITQGKYSQAEPLLRAAIRWDDAFGPAHNNLGLVYYYSEQLYQAAWEFERASKLMPRQGEPWNNLGLVYERAGEHEQAIDAYSRAHDFEKENAEFLGNWVRARIRRGDRDEETHKLLEQIALRDPRASWRQWAQSLVVRLQPGIPEDTPPTTQRSEPDSVRPKYSN